MRISPRYWELQLSTWELMQFSHKYTALQPSSYLLIYLYESQILVNFKNLFSRLLITSPYSLPKNESL